MVELLVAVVIMGVVLTLAVPAFNDLIARERLRGTNAQLLADLKYARSEAVQRNYRVVVDFRGSDTMACYSIYEFAGGECDCLQSNDPCPASAYAAPQSLLKLVQLPRARGVSMSTDGEKLTIESNRARHSRNLTITLRNNRGAQLVTTVSTRGLVTTCSPDGSMPGVPACATP
ncbi:GspH/FimT family pseudopilin [Aquincola tertiaricarbonis]|uniref:Type II secretion system protein H n=2 Tax=Aquincola tertiaricarbonis TaxID=391953 RepID=A0ABY4RYY2_AQUTE|nr:GspH/FimT family pseudopilin [Aquincola tertiaricarbonis]